MIFFYFLKIIFDNSKTLKNINFKLKKLIFLKTGISKQVLNE